MDMSILNEMKNPVRVVVFTREVGCEACPGMLDLARQIRSGSAKIALEYYDVTMDRDKAEQYGIRLVPSIAVQGGDGRFVVFSGTIEGVFLDILLDTMIAVSKGKAWFPERIRETLRLLERQVSLQVFVDSDCPLCRPVAETAIGMAMESDLVASVIIIASDFPDLIKKYSINTLPKTVFGSNIHIDGHVSESQFLELIFKAEGVRPGMGRPCLICGKPAADVICTACKTKIQAEAVEHRLRTEKGLKQA